MIFLLIIIGIFIAASIYYYFKAEGLNQQLVGIRRELFETRKESQTLLEASTLIAQKSEEMLKQRFTMIQNRLGEDKSVDIYAPLINNYAKIFLETMRGKGQMHKVTQKCYEGFQVGSYRRFTGFVGSLDTPIKRAWGQNNLSGLITFIELIATHYEAVEKKSLLASGSNSAQQRDP